MNSIVLKRILVVFFCAGCMFFLYSQENNPRVSIMPFNYPESVDKNDAMALTGYFESAVVKTGAFIVVKQTAVNVILKAQAFSVQDYVDKNYAIKIGQLVSANRIFLGSLSRLGARWILDVQLIDIEKGQALKAGNSEALSIEGLFDKMDALAASFAEGSSKTSTMEFAAKVKVYIDLGDRFLADQKYEKAIEQYEKALKVEEFNVHIIRKCIQANVEKILVNSLYLAHAVNDGLDIALRDDYQFIRFIPAAEIDNIIEQILLLKTLDSVYEKDPALLLEEATVYKVAGKVEEAIKILETAHKLAPGNDNITAELGLLYAFQAYQTKKENNGIQLIRQAVSKAPENPLYRLYLARSLERGNRINAEAIREYRKAAELATAGDFRTQRIHMFAAQSLQRDFYDLGAYPGGILTKTLEMDFEERLEHLLYLQDNEISFYSKTDIQNPDFYLAALYLAANRLMEADNSMRMMIENNKAYWSKNTAWLTLFKEILEKGKNNPQLLGEVRKYLEKAQE